MVDLLHIPALYSTYYEGMRSLKGRLSEIDISLPSSILEDAIDAAAPEEVVARLARMHQEQAPQLEALLLETTLQKGMPLWIGINEPDKAWIQYALRVEGRCLACYEKGDENKGLKVHTVNVGEPVTLAELQRNWRQIMVLDRQVMEDETIRERYSPICRNRAGKVHNGGTLLTSTVHGFTLLNPDGTVALPVLKYGARTKSGLETAFKHTEWLTGKKESVPDYLASRGICTGEELHRRFALFMKGYDDKMDWDGLILTQRCEAVIRGFEDALEGERDLWGFYRSRLQPNMRIERMSKGQPAEYKFIEVMLPVEGVQEQAAYNQINHHFYTEEWLTRIEGTDLSRSRKPGMRRTDLNHMGYAAMRDTRRLDEWTPLMWLVFQKIAVPIFVPAFPEERQFAERAAEQRLRSYSSSRR